MQPSSDSLFTSLAKANSFYARALYLYEVQFKMEPTKMTIIASESVIPTSAVNDTIMPRMGYTILAVIIGFFSVFGIILNMTVIVVTLKHRQLRQPLNFALVNLAVADLGCATFGGLPTMVTNAMGYFSLGRVGCVLEGFAVAFFGEYLFWTFFIYVLLNLIDHEWWL